MYLIAAGRQSMAELRGEYPEEDMKTTQTNNLSHRPEDIFGSVEVDGNGNFVGNNGNYQSSGRYLERASESH